MNFGAPESNGEELKKEYIDALKRRIEEEEIEGKVLSFSDPEQDKTTTLRINKVNRILGSGSYSDWVAEVNVEFTDREKNKSRDMVLKKYREVGMDGLDNLLQSYKNYKLLKSINVATWNTYRINESEKIAIMTVGSDEGEILITANDDIETVVPEIFETNPVKEIENIDEFIEKLRVILEKVNNNVFRLHADSWGVVFKPVKDKIGCYVLDVLISDLDSLDKSDNPHYIKHYGSSITYRWLNENLRNLGSALYCIYPGSRDEKSIFSESITSKLKSYSK